MFKNNFISVVELLFSIYEVSVIFRLLDVGRRLDKADREGVSLVAQHLCRLKQLNYTTEMYKKLGDERSIVLLYVEAREWKEAFALAETHPEYRDLVFVPYAQWLAENDKFAEAQKGETLTIKVRT